MGTKLLIVGGVAGGATAAARARRIDERAEIILFERGEYMSFANCGLPYYVGRVIQERDNLLVANRELFVKRYNVDVRNFSEVVEIDRANKRVKVQNLATGETYDETYDKIILSPGAEPIKPPIDGVDLENIFTLRNIPDVDRIMAAIETSRPTSAVVVGGGFIGLEMAENLTHRGIKTTVVEMTNQIMPPIDYEMAVMARNHLEEKGVVCELENAVEAFSKKGDKILTKTQKGRDIECDLVIMAIGVRAENKLAREAGLEIGARGGIVVDSSLRTSDPDIFAVGDAAEVREFPTGLPAMIPLAGPANKQGRIAADNALGRKSFFKGSLGTAIVKLFDLTVASVGLSEKTLRQRGAPYLVNHTHSASHASYYPGASNMAIKLLFSPSDGQILGAQIVGEDGVDKRIDILATAIRGRMNVFDLEELELAYAPPYGSAKDPVNIAGFAAANILKGDVGTVNFDGLPGADADNIIIDVRNKDELEEHGVIEGAQNIPLDSLRNRLEQLDKDKNYTVFCAMGMRGYLGCRIMTQNGFKAKNLSGGFKTFSKEL